MRTQIGFIVAMLILVSGLAAKGVPTYGGPGQSPLSAAHTSSLAGRWRVKFNLSGVGDNTLVFDSQNKGLGSFLLVDDPNNKAGVVPSPAVWSETTNNRVSFSGEVELQLGTCCREAGTLIFKGKFDSSDSISGRAIFVGSTIDEENFNGVRSTVGTFTAVPLPK